MSRNGSYARVCADLSLDPGSLPPAWRTAWAAAMRSYPAEGMDFLKAGYFTSANEYLRLPAEDLKAIVDAAAAVSGGDSLKRLLWLNHFILYGRAGGPKRGFALPSLASALGELADVFPVVLLLSGLPQMLAYYRENGIGNDVLIDTLRDVAIWMEDFRRKRGRPGLAEFRWLVNHFHCRLFRIGRLQYIHTTFREPVAVYRNKGDGSVAAFSTGGVRFREDGQVSGTNGVEAGEGGWTSFFHAGGGVLRGTALSPEGRALREPVTLGGREWEKALCRGNGVLDVHIPADGRMDAEACRQSFEGALLFYERHFPEKEIKAFVCESWLLDPQLRRILDGGSNIARLQDELFLFPILSDDRQTFERVFDRLPGPLEPSEARSSLQKAIYEHVKAGNRMHGGAMFLLKDDLKRWGTSFYNRRG